MISSITFELKGKFGETEGESIYLHSTGDQLSVSEYEVLDEVFSIRSIIPSSQIVRIVLNLIFLEALGTGQDLNFLTRTKI